MTIVKLNAVAFLTLVCATGATATDYYWNPSAATGRLTLLETWGTMSGGTWTAATELPTTSDTLILNGGSATLETAEAEYGTDGKVEFPAFVVQNGGILEMAFPAGVQYVQGGEMSVGQNSMLRVSSGTFFTNGKAMPLYSNAKAVFSGPDAILTTRVQGGHVNNNVQFWDTNPTCEFENGAVASNAYFIAWGAGSCVRLTGAGTRLVAGSTINFSLNKSATGSRIEVTDGARVEASGMDIGADESSILLRGMTYTNGMVTLNGLRSSGECLSSTLNTSINFGGTDSRLFVSNCTATAEKKYWRFGAGGGVGSEVTVTGGSNLSMGELVVGSQKSTNTTLRVTGVGTRMSVRCSNPHENSATIHMGYSASGGVNTAAEITDAGVGAQIVVDDGAYLEIVPTAGTTTPGSVNGLVIGKATNGDRCRFTVGPGGEVYSRYGTHIGGTHSTWGGGSLGELLVSNGVYRSDASVTINGGTAGNPLRASTNNVLSVVAGGEATFAGTLLFNSTSETGNGLVRVDNGSLTVLNVRATTSGKYGPSTVEIGGTNGTLTASHLVDVSSPLNLRFKIGEAGRSTAEPMIHLTSTGYYHLPNTKEGLDNFTLRFDIDRKWAESGRSNYVDLLTMDEVTGNSTVDAMDAMNKSQLMALKDKIVAGDLIKGCRLEVTADGRTLRLFAGPRAGTMLLIR